MHTVGQGALLLAYFKMESVPTTGSGDVRLTVETQAGLVTPPYILNASCRRSGMRHSVCRSSCSVPES